MKYVVFCFFTSILLSSCSKMGDTEKPKVTITSPNQKDTISGSVSEVSMQFNASDNISLSSLILEITDSNGSVLFADSKQIFGTSYAYKNSFVITKHPSKIKELTMVVHISDESHNEEITSATFYLAPSN